MTDQPPKAEAFAIFMKPQLYHWKTGALLPVNWRGIAEVFIQRPTQVSFHLLCETYLDANGERKWLVVGER